MMNILHCPKCGGEIILNAIYTFTFTKKIILTGDEFDEYSNRVADGCSSSPVQRLGSAYCQSCEKQWERPFYEVGVNINDGSASLIELNNEERKKTYSSRKKYFMEKGIKIIT